MLDKQNLALQWYTWATTSVHQVGICGGMGRLYGGCGEYVSRMEAMERKGGFGILMRALDMGI